MHVMPTPLLNLELARARTEQLRREADATRYDRRRASRSRRDGGGPGSSVTGA